MFLFREGNLSTKQIVFLQRPSLPQKAKKKESKVNNLEFLVSLGFAGGIFILKLISHRSKMAYSVFLPHTNATRNGTVQMKETKNAQMMSKLLDFLLC